MTTKQILQLFLPPIYYRLKAKIKYGKPIFGVELNQEEKLCTSLRDINARKGLSLSDLEELTQEPLYGGSILMFTFLLYIGFLLMVSPDSVCLRRQCFKNIYCVG